MATSSEIASLRSLITTLSVEVSRGHSSADLEKRGRAAASQAVLTSLNAMAGLYGWWETEEAVAS